MWIADLDVNRWVLLAFINLFLLVAGFFLPPVAVILMTAPILLPIITQAGFDPYWFAVVLTINMEIGLITPPVGPESLCHQRHRAGHVAGDDPQGCPALRAVHGARHHHPLHLPGDRHLAADLPHGTCALMIASTHARRPASGSCR